ncbi:GNAT family N-acetyltransferase [Shewanella sp. HL-SH5]|uniref:GNAT family N-acetyltransferase n=1 Tax=Shewanella sp. HL-SH5 TaxID=3436241 RepID=UPI003EB7E6FC
MSKNTLPKSVIAKISAPSLLSERFVIRRFITSDLVVFSEYRNVVYIAKYQSWTAYSLDDAKQLLAQTDYTDFAVPGNWYQLAIADPLTDQILGDLAVHFIDEQQVEVGFTVAPQHQNQGLATQALQGLLEYLFTELRLHRVIAITDCLNKASIAVLEKANFRQEGHFKQNVMFKGKWGDEYLYAMLASEFSQC